MIAADTDSNIDSIRLTEHVHLGSGSSLGALVTRVVVACIAWVATAFATNDTASFYFFAITLLLSFYLLWEAFSLPKTSLPRILDPMVVASVTFFGLSHGAITNYFLWLDSGEFSFAFISQRLAGQPVHSVTAMALVTTCAVTTWQAYRTQYGALAADFLRRSVKHTRLLEGRIAFSRLLVFVVLACMIRLFMFRIGLHGRVVSSEYFDASRGYMAFSEIRRLNGLCMMIMAVAVLCDGRQQTSTSRLLMVISFSVEILFGFLYGARSAIVLPFALAAIVRSYTLERFSIGFSILGLASLLFALTIGNEFKHYVIKHGYQELGVVDTLLQFANERDEFSKFGGSGRWTRTIETNARNMGKNFELTALVQYAHTSNTETPAGLVRKDLCVAPALVVSTRKMIGVPNFPWGLWFKDKVLRRNIGSKYSVGFSPIGFLLLGGGIPLVIVGAFAYGCALRFTREVVGFGDLGFLMYLALMSQLYSPNTVVSGTIVDVGRYLIFMPVMFALLFRDNKGAS